MIIPLVDCGDGGEGKDEREMFTGPVRQLRVTRVEKGEEFKISHNARRDMASDFESACHCIIANINGNFDSYYSDKQRGECLLVLPFAAL